MDRDEVTAFLRVCEALTTVIIEGSRLTQREEMLVRSSMIYLESAMLMKDKESD